MRANLLALTLASIIGDVPRTGMESNNSNPALPFKDLPLPKSVKDFVEKNPEGLRRFMRTVNTCRKDFDIRVRVPAPQHIQDAIKQKAAEKRARKNRTRRSHWLLEGIDYNVPESTVSETI